MSFRGQPIIIYSYEEAGRYLETYKAFENKPPDMLVERVDSDFLSRVSLQEHMYTCAHTHTHTHTHLKGTECLTTVKKVNKTDAVTLLNNFKVSHAVENMCAHTATVLKDFVFSRLWTR